MVQNKKILITNESKRSLESKFTTDARNELLGQKYVLKLTHHNDIGGHPS